MVSQLAHNQQIGGSNPPLATMSIIIPVEYPKDPKDRPRKTIHLYHLTTTYDAEIEKFIGAIRRGGGKFCACLEIDYHNAWGDMMGKQYAILYQAEEEISIEQWC